MFELTDVDWRLHFRHLDATIACGLLRSTVDVGPIGKRRCLLTLTNADQPAFLVHLVVRARPRKVRADVEARMEGLEGGRELAAAIAAGQWWRDPAAFEQWGACRAHSIVGVRYLDGLPRTTKVKSTRSRQLVDVGPNGISLRGWRTHLTIPWEHVASAEVVDHCAAAAESGETDERPRAVPVLGTDATLELDLHDGSRVRFGAPRSSLDDLHATFEPLSRFIGPGVHRATTPNRH